jgi:FtsP/CotA-like multicopper oxidase with cupredoxin domain
MMISVCPSGCVCHAVRAPGSKVKRGQSCVLTLRNDTAWWHPMHLHGHSFRVLSRNGSPVA